MPLRPGRGHADDTVDAAEVGTSTDALSGASAGAKCGASFGTIFDAPGFAAPGAFGGTLSAPRAASRVSCDKGIPTLFRRCT